MSHYREGGRTSNGNGKKKYWYTLTKIINRLACKCCKISTDKIEKN